MAIATAAAGAEAGAAAGASAHHCREVVPREVEAARRKRGLQRAAREEGAGAVLAVEAGFAPAVPFYAHAMARAIVQGLT